MKTRWLLFGVAFGVSTLLAGAGDWPQWRGPGRDNKVVGFTAPAAWPKELTQKWKVNVGLSDGSPVLVGDKVFVFTRQGGDEVIQCLEATTGKEVWKDKYAAVAVTGGGSGHPGPRATPAVADGKVCTLGVGGVISCLDAATGKVAWRKDTNSWPMFFTSFSPIIVDGTCIVHTGSSGKGGAKGQLTAYELATGKEKWSWTGDGPSYSSPVLMTIGGAKQVVALTDQFLIGIGLDGKQLWQIPQKGKYNSVTPIVDGDTVIYAGEGSGTFALKVEKMGDTYNTKQLWKKNQSPNKYNTPVLKDGKLYGLSPGPGRNFYCMDATTGDVLWTDTTQRGDCGAILDAGSVMLALTSDMNLVVFKPNPKEYEEITKYKVADSPPWAMPIVDGKRLFVKDRDSLILWTIE